MVLVVDTLSRAPRSEETGISMIKYQPTANANHLCCNCSYILLGCMYTIYIYIIVTNIQTRLRQCKFHPLTYPREVHFACQLPSHQK